MWVLLPLSSSDGDDRVCGCCCHSNAVLLDNGNVVFPKLTLAPDFLVELSRVVSDSLQEVRHAFSQRRLGGRGWSSRLNGLELEVVVG